MKEISKLTTKELVDELSKREGVQRVNIDPHTQKVEVAVYDSATNKYPHDEITEGPCIILKVID